MKKYIVSFSILFCTLVVGCANPNSSSNDLSQIESNSSENNQNNFSEFDINDYVANITDANGLGIRNKGKNLKSKRKNSDDYEQENVLIKTTTEYGEGNVIISDNKIEEVTFTKIDTTVKTYEITGEEEYIANNKDGSIVFKAYSGFNYTITHDNTILFSDIKDNDANDCDEKTGIIKIDGLNKGKSYIVSYIGYGEEKTITQSEVGAEIDKLCVLDGQFSFISFVPKGESKRPLEQDLVLDKDGIALYDKTNYISNNERKNYVLDNCSGLIYDLKNVSITRIDGNLVRILNVYNELSVDENGNLVLTPICKNDKINVRYAFKDKYDNKYILNDRLETYDPNTNTYYYVTGPNIWEPRQEVNCLVPHHERYFYIRTSNDEAVRVPVYFQTYEMATKSKTMDIILSNGDSRQINETDTFDLYPFIGEDYFTFEPKNVINGVLRMEAYYTGHNDNYFINTVREQGFYYLQNQKNKVKYYSFDSSWSGTCEENIYFMDSYDVILFYNDGVVYSIQNCFQYALNMEKVTQSDIVRLGDFDSHFEVDGEYVNILISDVIIEYGKIINYGVDGNKMFDVYVKGDRENPIIEIYETGTYTPPAPSENTIVIQPINR